MALWTPGDDVIEVVRGPEAGGPGGFYRAFGETLRGLKTTFARQSRGRPDAPVPRGQGPGVPALPRAPPAAPLRGHRAWRSASAARCAPPPARPTASASSRPRTRRRTACQRRRALRRGLRDQPRRAASSAATARSRARSTRSRWATTTRCPTTTAPISSSPRRCCWPSPWSARRCGREGE